MVGFGGIVVTNETPADSSRYVAEAVDRGVNYFDVAPAYGDAEERLGPALEPYRRDIFLACKTNKRDAAQAEQDFRSSLKTLRTDYIDLYQIHGIQTEQEVDAVLAPGGALSFFEELRRRGEIRHIGFSAHNEDAALRLLAAFPFDSVLFPVNWVTWHAGNVGPRIVQAAATRGTAVLALKALALQRWKEGEERTWSKPWYRPVSSAAEAERGLRFTLSQPVVAAVSPGHMEHLRWACDAADRFTPLSEDEHDQLRREALEMEPIFSRTVTAI